MNKSKALFGISLTVFLLLFLTSCVSSKKMLYLQKAEGQSEMVNSYVNTLQKDDNLLITVTAPKPELVSEFNMMYLNARSTETNNSNNELLYTYLIDQKGEINFPVLGKIKLEGLTRIEAESKLKLMLADYVKNVGVNIRVTNFKVSVLGEVTRPGQQVVVGDRITIFEALSAAGDLTIYGKRKDITLVREENGEKIIASIDITDADLINSEYYYLSHNDVLIVKPNKTRINSSSVGPNLTLGLSAISLLVTIIALTTR